MTKNWLARIRFLGPAVIGLVVFRSLVDPAVAPQGGFAELSGDKLTPATIGALLLAFVYRVTHLRDRLLLQPDWDSINRNISRQLLSLLPEGELSEAHATELLRGKRLTNLFYSVVDNDASLRERRDGVYENGAYVSGAADLLLFSTLGCIGHIMLLTQRWDWVRLYWVFGWMGAAFLGAFLLFAALNRHYRLSNEQLSFIADHHKETVVKGIRALSPD